MGKAFEPHVEKVLPVLFAHMKDNSKILRKLVYKTFQYLLIAKGEPGNIELFQRIYSQFAMSILVTNASGDIKQLKLLFKSLHQCFRVMSENEDEGNRKIFHDEATLNTFGGMMQRCLNTVFNKRTEHRADLEKRQQDGQIDEEDLAEAQEQLYKIGKAAHYVGECASVLATVYKKGVGKLLIDNVKPFFD
jgi:hypothetical protein